MRFLLLIGLCVAAAYATAFWLAVPANPELKFWRVVDLQRDEGMAGIREARPGQPMVLFTGGSSCAFSIDPLIIEQACGVPAYNLGMPVAAGAKFILHQALEKALPGDTLVVCLEPDLLTFPEKFNPSTLSFGLATLAGEPSAAVGGTSFDRNLTLRDCLNLSRPGPTHLATLIAKTASGKESYRYVSEDLRYRGRIETPDRDPDLPRIGRKSADQLLPAARELLATFREAAANKGVRLAYSMPWVLTAPDAAETNRATNRRILDAVDPVLPVLDDGQLGVSTDPAHFSDSGLHLSAEGSRLRSAALARSLDPWLKSAPPAPSQ